MSVRKRHCIECGRSIEACFGFTLGRDISAALAGTLPMEWVRELCGLCVLRRDVKDNFAEYLAVGVIILATQDAPTTEYGE